MKILALDTATRTGWAISDHFNPLSSPALYSGVEDFSIRTKATKTLERDHPGQRFSLFNGWLRRVLRDNQIDLIVYERIVGGAHAGGNVSLIQKGFEAIVLMNACYYFPTGRPTPCWTFAAGTIKKWATNNGALKNAEKHQMIEAAVRNFPNQDFARNTKLKVDDNQCDALHIWDLARAVAQSMGVTSIGDISPSDCEEDNLTLLAGKAIKHKWR